MMVGMETRSCHGVFGHHAKFDMVQQYVQCCLILDITPGHTDGDDGFAILQDERRSQGNSGPLACHNTIGMIE